MQRLFFVFRFLQSPVGTGPTKAPSFLFSSLVSLVRSFGLNLSLTSCRFFRVSDVAELFFKVLAVLIILQIVLALNFFLEVVVKLLIEVRNVEFVYDF